MNNFLKKNTKFSFYFLIIFFSLIYSILHGEGFYGFNIDYYEEYSKKNLKIEFQFDLIVFDSLGLSLSTLTLFDKNIGVHLLSFILAFSSGILLKKFLEIRKIYSNIYFFLIFLLMLHIHPIIMSTSSAMRQGWAMSFLFISFYAWLSELKKTSLLLICIAVFFHKSGPILFTVFIITFFFNLVLNKVINKKLIFTLFGLFSFFLFHYIFKIIFEGKSTRVVYGDFRLLWFIINFFFILLFFYYNKLFLSSKFRFIITYCFIISCAAPNLLLLNLNDQYERINMIMGVPYLLVFGLIFKREFYLSVIAILIIFYLYLTIQQGMYTIGLT